MDHSLKDVIHRIKLGFSFNARFDPCSNTILTPAKNDESKTDGDKKDSSKKEGETPPVKEGETPPVKEGKTPPVKKSPRWQEDDHKSSDSLKERLKAETARAIKNAKIGLVLAFIPITEDDHNKASHLETMQMKRERLLQTALQNSEFAHRVYHAVEEMKDEDFHVVFHDKAYVQKLSSKALELGLGGLSD